jgi:hypothetical protein
MKRTPALRGDLPVVDGDYPVVICERCSVAMQVIGVGSASGRLKYHCLMCGGERWGKSLAQIEIDAVYYRPKKE